MNAFASLLIRGDSFLTFLYHHLVQGRPVFSHPVFSILCHVFSQLVLLHVSLYVVPPSHISVGLRSFSQKPLVLAISVTIPPNRNGEQPGYHADDIGKFDCSQQNHSKPKREQT